MVRRAEIPWLKLPEPKVQTPQNKTPEPIVAKKEAPVPEVKKEAPPVEKVKRRVPLPREVDIDMTLVTDAPLPKVQVASAPAQPRSPVRIRAADMDMELEIAAEPRPSSTPPGSAQGRSRAQAISPANVGAGYLSMSMEIAPEKVTRPGAGKGRTPGISAGRSILGFGAKAHAATLDDVLMSLDIQQGGGNGMKSRTPGNLMGTGGKGKPARVLSTGSRGMGSIELPLGLPGNDGSGQAVLASAGPSSQQGTPGARMIVQHAEGSIALGVPLAFRLADVGDETVSGSAYLARSVQLKRLLESYSLPSTPVTVPIDETDGVSRQGDRIVSMSYCKNQIVLQFGSGKQQVVTLAADEPYPGFELRLAPNGSQNVPVGSKLEEITVCLQALQHVL